MSLRRYDKEKDLTIKDLILRLKKEGFASSKRTIWMWENQGVIPKAERAILPNGWEGRVYTKEEIQQIVNILRVSPQKKTLIC